MTYAIKPEGTIETSIGTVRFHMTNATHVYLYTEQPSEKVVIRQIPYKLNYHCYLADGVWDRNHDMTSWNEPGLSRKDKYADTSTPARKTARAILNKAWTEFIAAHPEVARAAAASNSDAEIERLQAELTDLIDKTAAVKVKLDAAKLARACIG